MKTRFYLKSIIDNIPYRPKEYYNEVISAGKIIDDYLELDIEEAKKLIKKYHEKNPAEGKLHTAVEWGPVLWGELHKRTDEYIGEEEKERRWLQIFTSWIPCGECKSHWVGLTKENPVDLSSKNNYRDWAIRMHNKVNERLNKPIYEPAG
jgi:hypothetical protein